MNDPHYLNPQIFPSNKNLKPADHHRILYSAVAILLCASILGGIYWWQTPTDVPAEVSVNPRVEAINRLKSMSYATASTTVIQKALSSIPPPKPVSASTSEARAQAIEKLRLQNNN
jgi:hypothetical protein